MPKDGVIGECVRDGFGSGQIVETRMKECINVDRTTPEQSGEREKKRGSLRTKGNEGTRVVSLVL